MLKRLHDTAGQDTALALSQVDSLAPFTYGLEYSAPARGGWTIVHIGMLLPESHQVFVCAQSCLRGVGTVGCGAWRQQPFFYHIRG